MQCGLVIVGAGSGARLGLPVRKAMVPLGSHPLIVTTARRFAGIDRILEVVLVAHSDDCEELSGDDSRTALSGLKVAAVVPGGANRTDSVQAGVAALSINIDSVLIHDAARPFVTRREIEAVLDALASGAEGAFPSVPLTSTIKRIDSLSRVTGTVDRSELVAALTPQGAKRDLLLHALAQVGDAPPTDEMQSLESVGVAPLAVQGDVMNFKITTQSDLELARRLMGDLSS